MKTRLQRWPGNSTLRFSAPMLALSLLLATLPAGAATSFTTTNWVAGVPVPGILCTNGLGQVYLKGNVHVHRVVSAEARIAGRLQAWMDLAYQTDGTAIFGGPAYAELGTWDAAGTNFTPSGGVWDLKYSGVAQADGSDQVHLVGYGIGGAIDGLRVELTATKGPGAPFDPTVPYVSSGTIKPAPVTVTNGIALTGAASWPDVSLGTQGSITTSGGQMTMRAAWPGKSTVYPWDTIAWASPMVAWAVTTNHTLEARVDVVSVSDASANAFIALYHVGGQGYWLQRGPDHVTLGKQASGGVSFFSGARVAARKTNEVLVLALTPSGNNVIVTGRVLDRDNSEAVICETSVLDTPSSDPSLTAAQVTSITGMNLLGIVPDPAGAPWTTGISPTLMMLQYTDGTLPAAGVTFAHFELRNYEIPPIGISRAVQVGWPCPADVNYAVESAPTLQGPWLPVSIQVPPGMQQMTVPANGSSMFFRLRQAP